MKLIPTLALVLFFFSGSQAPAVEGGELGNAFVPFASRIGRYSLEYDKDWRLIDLSSTTNFTENQPSLSGAGSFFTVAVDSNGARGLPELKERLTKAYPGVAWAGVSISNLSGLEGAANGVRMIYLLRAPSDQISLRLSSTDGARSDEILSKMLTSFRAD
ncbi:MAG: hypothetical protein ACXVCI_01070 [Bdellovibrionota bacterium]